MTIPVELSSTDRIVGREMVLGHFDTFLESARAGHGGGVVLFGESGIGKTTVLRSVAGRADGMIVLAATGLKSEATLAFATLGDLLRPLLPHLDELPAPQAAALRTALALDDGTASLGRYAVCLGVLTLLSAAAETRPVLVVVDDAQWMDTESAAALMFAARRLENDAVLVILAHRDEPGRDFDPAGLTAFHLAGLDPAASGTLLASLSTEPVAPVVADRLHAVTGGNPLALREIGRRLSAAELAARLAMPDPLPIGAEVRRMFAARLDSLPAPTRLALLVLALSSSAAADRLTGPLHALGLDSSTLEPARTAGLVTADSTQVCFAHPLIRSVVQADATAIARHDAYAALASATTGDEALLYRAAGATGPDDTLAAELEAAADRTHDRLGFAGATRMLHRAATLTTGPDHRARRLLAGATSALIAGRADEAAGWLETARELTGDPAMIAQVELTRGRALTMRGTPAIAREVLVGAADAVAGHDPRGAARLLSEAVLPAFTEGRIDDAVALCDRAVVLADRVGAAAEQGQSRLVLAQAHTLSGQTRPARREIDGLRPYLDRLDPVADGMVLSMLGAAQSWLERPADARQTLDRVVNACRRAGALGPLAIALSHRCETARQAGEWAQARADGEESLRLAGETWQPLTLGFVQVLLARLDAAQGRAEMAEWRLAEARQMSGPLGISGLVFWERGVLGLLHLAAGRPEEAIGCLEPVREFAGRHGLHNPGVVPWAPDLVEAYWRAGRPDRAAERLESFERRATATGLSAAEAAVHRCRGLLAADATTAERHFRTAMALHERCHRPFEQARTALCHGEVMRRHRRIAGSREPLAEALHTFRRLGAEPFAERAATELAAAGGATRPAGDAELVQQLSPQELQVAMAAARGHSNPAIAGLLFLSRKTVEAHLSRVYRKLEISSRNQLRASLATVDVTESPEPDPADDGRVPGSRTP
ncbi:DNA-binding CsgD family transcriptional regulator [Actinoplanes tereljensis]|uniref:Transcriptional regulator n=1 Tax=Paractinoplanes tereljensis TaxID=571912 RepID=A0A919NHN5_9ACTN|nr:LuxR family transcriptional regulator [Actinoplanes tereljensis]GIF18176.1 transcriptional regulator [Actinoplanes tereljensis]